jgi:hypothetical protein
MRPVNPVESPVIMALCFLRRALSKKRIAGAVIAGLVIAGAGASIGSSIGAGFASPSCTAEQKAERQHAAAAYAKRIPRERPMYFKRHTSAKERAAFVKRQKAKLAKLQHAAACTVPVPTSTSVTPPVGPVPAPPPRPNDRFVFGPEMSAAAQDEIKGDVAYAVQDEAVLLGTPITSVSAFASSKPDWLADQQCRFYGSGGSCFQDVQQRYAGGVTAAAGGGGLFLNWASPSWTYGASANQKIIAHEIFHIFQDQLDRLSSEPSSQVWRSGPVWLHEGAAEMVGYRVAADRRLFPSYASVLVSQIGVAKQISTPLSSLQTYNEAQIPNVYSLFHVAVDHLVNVAPGGLSALTAYYNALGSGMSWPQAFRAAFGMSVDAYYANFAAYRAGF